MEITKELRCKAIAAYLDCKAEIGTTKVYLFGINSGEGELYSADLLEDGSIDHDALPDTLYVIEECTLLLTPLSKITNEHAIEVAKIYYAGSGGWQQGKGIVLMMLGNHIGQIELNKMIAIIDYLRSVGYDLGYGSIKSLIESGIAKDATL